MRYVWKHDGVQLIESELLGAAEFGALCFLEQIRHECWKIRMLDIRFEVGGKRVNANNLGDALEDMMFSAVADQLRKELSGVRDPETGEFPVVAFRGSDLSNLTIEITGSERVIRLAQERLGIDEDLGNAMKEPSKKPTKVFLSHASEDKQIARQIAERLIGNGIDTFFDEWEIRPGDSIRQRIDQGLEECTHFVVLATEQSIEKEWVKTEIDGVYRKKIEGQCRLIPLRHKLDARRLPPSLGSLHAPSLDNFDADIEALVHTIYDVSNKPPLGAPPSVVMDRSPRGGIGISAAAESLVRLCMADTEHGDFGDPQLDKQTIITRTGLTDHDIIDAVDELEAMGLVDHLRHIGDGGLGHVMPQRSLYAKFDRYFNEWDPASDALQVAAALLNDVCTGNTQELAGHFGWPPRRTNPALTYLVERDLVFASQSIGTCPWSFA